MEKAMEEIVGIYESIQATPLYRYDEELDEESSTSLNVISLGNVGAGKSAVLNSLIGHRVLPMGRNSVTRVPICIDVQRDGSLNTKHIVSTIDNITWQITARNIRKILQKKIFDEDQHDEIYLKIRTSTAPPLKLIDLPGLTRRTMDDFLSKKKTMDDSMIRDFAEYNDAILLVIVPASEAPEISSSRALRLAKELDVDGTRTIGVISKVDEASSNQEALSAVQALLLDQGTGNADGIKWVALNPLIGFSVSIASAQSAESKSLKSIMPGVPQNKLGTVALLETIVWQIRYHKEVRPSTRISRRSRSGRRKKEKIEKRTVPLNIEKLNKKLVMSSIDLSDFSSMESLRAHIRSELYPSDSDDSNIGLKLVFRGGSKGPFIYHDNQDATDAKLLFQTTTELEVIEEASERAYSPTTIIIKNSKNRIYYMQFDLSRFTSLEALRKMLRIMVDRSNHECRIQLTFTLKGKKVSFTNDEEMLEVFAYESSSQLEVELERPSLPPAPSSPPHRFRKIIKIYM